MFLRWLLLAAGASGIVLAAETGIPRAAPFYAGASVVNAADNLPGPLTPNGIATVYGSGLAYITKAIAASDIRGGLLPTVLPGTGVHVIVGGIAAGIYYVSPNQINFLVPSILIPGSSDVQISIDALAGPDVVIQLAAGSPAFFQLDQHTLIATRADGSLITADAPAQRGDVVVLYATGLGAVNPPLANLQVPTAAAQIRQIADLKVMADGTQIDPGLILYAGVAPGFGGLYQINVRLPDSIGANPEIRVSLANLSSPAGFIIAVKP